MGLFKYFIKKRELAAARKAKKLEIIKADWAELKQWGEDQSQLYYNEENIRSERSKSCPICGNKNVVDHIKRLQGKFSSSGSVSGMSIFGTGLISGSSSGSGSVDTNEVNRCNNPDCGHEWKKYKRNYKSDRSFIESKLSTLFYSLVELKKAQEAKVDPDDLDEKYTTDKEKREALLKLVFSGYWFIDSFETLSKYSIESLEEIMLKEFNSALEYNYNKYWSAKNMEILGYKHINLND